MRHKMKEHGVHVAAVVKGVIEQDDASHHFHSFGGLNHYIGEAVRLGFVRETPSGLEATKVGEKWWEEELADLKARFANYWSVE